MISASEKLFVCRKRCLFLFVCLAGINIHAFAQHSEYTVVPFSEMFHDFGKNLWHSVAYNDGLNLISSGLATYTIVETGLDWKYYQMAYGNLAGYGMASNLIGYAVPVISPIATYIYGRVDKNEKLQILGCALAQTSVMATGVHILLKGVIARRAAGVYALDPQKTDYSKEFQLAFFTHGIIDGWPSGHAMNFVAAAATISEIYKENVWVKVAAYSYATVASIGMTFCDHWLSDVVAGWLLGYAIGKTVGRSFSNMNEANEQRIALNVGANYIGVKISFP